LRPLKSLAIPVSNEDGFRHAKGIQAATGDFGERKQSIFVARCPIAQLSPTRFL
jgi:hypothetical protein